MSKQADLFGKTFDQQVDATGGNLAGKDIRPNTLNQGEVVFEPVLNGVRVTARDKDHKLLWGVIASKGMLTQIHCPVALYDTLQSSIADELRKQGLPSVEDSDPVASAKAAVDALQKTLNDLNKSVTVKKVSEATRERARVIKRIVNDANRLIQLESP
jgi:hypothetical protein